MSSSGLAYFSSSRYQLWSALDLRCDVSILCAVTYKAHWSDMRARWPMA